MPSSSPRPISDVMQRLRERTAPIHAATEALPLMHKLLAPEADAADYQRYLSALHGVYLSVEPTLYAATSPAVLTRLGIRPKLPALRKDLEALGASPDPTPPGLTRHLRAIVADELAALGGLYVLEGATLGGRVIARRLRKKWASAGDMPFDFLDFRGPDPAGEFRQFGIGLRERVSELSAWPHRSQAADEAVVVGAVAVFEAMHQAFSNADPGAAQQQQAV